MKKIQILFVSILLLQPTLLPAAKDYLPEGFETPYSPNLSAGSTCFLPITKLHPTQALAGMKEVEHKKDKVDGKSPAKLTKYLADHVVPVVIGPDGVPFMTDHHHTCLALLESGRVTDVPAKVIANWSDLDVADFWKKMKSNHYCWLKNAQGQPISPEQLPSTVRGLSDDPWRAVVWKLEHLDVLQKKSVYFYEFHWADFLEEHVDADPSKNFSGAVEASRKFIEAHPGMTPKIGRVSEVEERHLHLPSESQSS